MTVITLVLKNKGKYSGNSSYHDKALEAGAITIDQDAYTAGLDRIYDIKGLQNMHVEIENTGGTNGLTYKIEKARKEFIDDGSSLVDADFDQVILANTNVAFGTTNIQDIVDISPETTAIRISIKRQTSGNDTTLAGIVSVN